MLHRIASTVHLRPVLVVEDDADSRTMLSMILSMKGYLTVAANQWSGGAPGRPRIPPVLDTARPDDARDGR